MRSHIERIEIKITPDDKKKIKERMKEAGIKNMSAYIRKMAIDRFFGHSDYDVSTPEGYIE